MSGMFFLKHSEVVKHTVDACRDRDKSELKWEMHRDQGFKAPTTTTTHDNTISVSITSTTDAYTYFKPHSVQFS